MLRNLVRRERKKLKLTLRELSLISGIAQPDLSAIERGKRQIFPTWRKRLSMALKTPEENLFGGDAYGKNPSD